MPRADRNATARRASIPPAERVLVGDEDGAALWSVSGPTFLRLAEATGVSPVELPLDVRRRLWRVEDLRLAFGRTPEGEGR